MLNALFEAHSQTLRREAVVSIAPAYLAQLHTLPTAKIGNGQTGGCFFLPEGVFVMAEIRPTRHQMRSGKLFFIRAALAKDAPAVLELARQVIGESVYSVTSPEEFNVGVEEEIQFLEGFRRDPGKLFLVAETADKRIVGNLDFAVGHFLRHRHVGEFGMGVLREFRCEGVGSALLQDFLDWAIGETSIEKINLSVHAGNARAISLYEKFGFEKEGIRKRETKFDEFRYEDSMLMAKVIR